ncbi:MAG: VWA domain-containing protein, partial [Planctomycetota bacterium]
RVPVSTLMFWDRVYEEKAPRSLFERLRHLGSLLLQLLLIALLAFALADPFTDAEVREARHLVLVMDTSAGMAAPVDPENPSAGTRLDAAKEKAFELVKGLRHRDTAAVLTAGASAEVVCGTTGHPPTLAAALAEVQQTDAPGAVPAALALARRLVAGRENGRVLLLSDRLPEDQEPPADALITPPAGDEEEQSEVAEAPPPADDPVTLIPFGQPGGNVAITAFQVRRSLTDPIGYEILVEVSNFSDEPAEVRLDLDLAGVPVDVIPLELEPDEVWKRIFEKTDEAGGELTATLQFNSQERENEGDDSDEDAPAVPTPGNLLLADDAARAVLPARERIAVTLVTPGNLFLQQVFAANPLVDLTLTDSLPSSDPEGTVLVLHRTVPEELPPGAVFVVDPRNDTDLFAVGKEIEAPAVKATEAAEDSPVTANIRFDRIQIPKARVVTPADAGDDNRITTLAETEAGDPLLFAVRRPEGKALVLAVDFDATDLPLRTAFPILAVNALTWFTEAAGELRPAVATGALVTTPLPEGAKSEQWSVISPAGTVEPLPAGLTEATLGPLAEAGLWGVVPLAVADDPREAGENAGTAPGDWPPEAIPLAVNLTSPTESDTRLVASVSETDAASAAGGGRPWWFWLAAVALILVGVEWWLYQRRFIQ